ncbi:hypothetical protein [Nocardiopsis sp. Huas11]|uniref:hypothetical protein n=1 Tax=Nocardiopsis sp. Huas11 TaxID=2183912 RepID=UPI0018F57343|nr:hypothetical protein [Nocardiopsis sp. Huas11]
MLISGVVVVCAAICIVVEPDVGGSFVFMAWDVLITWLICLVLGTYKYVVHRRAFREHRLTSLTDGEPDP